MHTRHPLPLFISPPQACPYLPARESVNIFVHPDRLTNRVYSYLIARGFRRSGTYVYRPACDQCTACISVRIPVAGFRPARRDRRCWRANEDLALVDRPAEFDAEHFDLYRRYLAARHPGGGMDNPDPAEYMQFLTAPWSETRFYEYRLGERLLAVAVTDHVDDGLSSVYTFFDPDQVRRGLGNYSILRQIDLARRLGRDWLYLGYWIADCAKMRYKGRYRPLQQYREGRWVEALEPAGAG